MNERMLNIVGPCAGESQDQINQTVAWASRQDNVAAIRGNFWKPRTKPGFEGNGIVVLDWMLSAFKNIDLILATEVLVPDHVTQIAQKLSTVANKNIEMILWIGSRNQNHIIQREIAERISVEMPKNTRLMIKNQPWKSKDHWMGIIDHVSPRLSDSRLIMCHRGFDPTGMHNPQEYRNIPDFPMAMQVKQETGLKMINDPSHEGGSIENVLAIAAFSAIFNFDGQMIEAHPNPKAALTDAKQQLTFDQASRLLRREEML